MKCLIIAAGKGSRLSQKGESKPLIPILGMPLFHSFWGGVLSQFASVIDGCDGEVTRLKFKASAYGGWLDAVLDRYADAFLLFGLTWHSYAEDGNGVVILIGFLAIIGSFVLSYTAEKYDSLMNSQIRQGAALRMSRDIRVFIIFLGRYSTRYILNQRGFSMEDTALRFKEFPWGDYRIN